MSQLNLFSLDTVPTGKPNRKNASRKPAGAQVDMFAGLAPQFGVNPRPMASITSTTRLALESEESPYVPEPESDQMSLPEPTPDDLRTWLRLVK